MWQYIDKASELSAEEHWDKWLLLFHHRHCGQSSRTLERFHDFSVRITREGRKVRWNFVEAEKRTSKKEVSQGVINSNFMGHTQPASSPRGQVEFPSSCRCQSALLYIMARRVDFTIRLFRTPGSRTLVLDFQCFQLSVLCGILLSEAIIHLF